MSASYMAYNCHLRLSMSPVAIGVAIRHWHLLWRIIGIFVPMFMSQIVIKFIVSKGHLTYCYTIRCELFTSAQKLRKTELNLPH